jgi:hypothetical protein
MWRVCPMRQDGTLPAIIDDRNWLELSSVNQLKWARGRWPWVITDKGYPTLPYGGILASTIEFKLVEGRRWTPLDLNLPSCWSTVYYCRMKKREDAKFVDF